MDSSMCNSFSRVKEVFVRVSFVNQTARRRKNIHILGSNRFSSVLMMERERVQHPIYYISNVLHDAKMRNTSLEKMMLALAITSSLLWY